jgi:5-methylcytosine-specific restriction endonuclease McrA
VIFWVLQWLLPKRKLYRPTADEVRRFYRRRRWSRAQYRYWKALPHRRCEWCRISVAAGDWTQVDHIHPIWTHWHLRYRQSNLQLLCERCLAAKVSWDVADRELID